MADYSNTSSQTSDPSTFEMSYGQYAGQQLSGIPTQYLRYVYANHAFTYNHELQRALEAYLGLPPDPQIRPGNAAAQAFAKGGGAATTPEAPASRPVGPRSGPNGGYGRAPQTGLDGFRAAFERARREALVQFEDDPDLLEMMEDLFAKVRRALGI